MGFHFKKKSRPKNGATLVYTKLLSIPHATHPKHGALVGAGSLWPSFEDCQAMKFTFVDLKCTLGESQCFFIAKFQPENMTSTNTKDFHGKICPNSPDFYDKFW
jgi:hypothetical protein